MSADLNTASLAPREQPVLAPIVGNIWQIQVAVGDVVDAGQTLMVLESMKMEIPIPAPTTGVVSAIPVVVTEIVQEGCVVAVVTEVPTP